MAKAVYSHDIIRFSRKERLPDSFVSTEVHPIEGRGVDCTMVTALAINSPWHHAREFGQQIVSTLVREFVRSQSNSNLIRFEHALKLANHTISQAAEKLGVTIDCAVALFIEQEVHFTVIGNCRLLLFRSGHLTDVTSADASAPDQFSSVTSGDLAEGEWLMVSAPGMVDFLRNQQPETWKESDIEAIAAEIIDQAPALERSSFFATLLRLRSDTAGQQQSIFWDNLDHATPIKLPKLSLPKFDLKPLAGLARGVSERIAAYKEKRSAAPVVVAKKAEQATDDVEVFEPTNPWWQRFTRVKLPKVNRRLLVISLIVLAVLFTSYRIIQSRTNRNMVERVPTLLEEFSATSAADRTAFLAAKFSYERYGDLSTEDKQTFRQLIADTGTPALEPTTVVTKIDHEVVAIDTLGSSLAAIDVTGQLWQYRDNKTIKVEQSIMVQQPRSIAFVATERIIVSDAAGNLWLFDGTPATQPIALTQPTSLGTGAKIVQAYAGNLYVYSPESKTVFRQSAFDKELSAPRSVGSFTTLTNPLADWAINSQIVAVDEQGQVVGLKAGKVQLTGTLAKTAQPLRLATIESAPNIYALSATYLLTSDKVLGASVANYLITKLPPTDLAIDQTDNSLWLAIGSELYKLPGA